MSQSSVPKALRDQVSHESQFRCGYCLSSEAVVGTPMELDHIVPEALGGATVLENLWLACSACNSHKADGIAGIDLETGQVARFFNPREQAWSDHFRWSPAGDEVIGITSCGRATVASLNMNRPALVYARRAWVRVGWHPPKD